MKSLQILLAVLILIVLAASIKAEVPQLISYQGRLTDDIGNPLPDGNYLVKFTIWSDADSFDPSDSLWSSGYRTITVIEGLFSYPLGDTIQFPQGLFASDTGRWLGIKVGADPEMSPRAELISVPYAFRSFHADTAMFALSGSIGMLFEDDNNYAVFYVSGEQTIKTFTIPAGQVEDYFRVYAYLEWHNLSYDLGIEAWLTANTGGVDDDTLEFFETTVGSARALLESTVMEAYPGTWVARRSSIAYPWAWVIPSLDTSQPLEIGLHVRSIGSGVNEVRTGKIVIEYTKH
jgi:hypothetical protein